MTDPQNDKPCRDCGAPTQHATEICDDCRTPAGRLVTALAALGVKATPIDSFDVVVDKITVSADHLSWCLLCDDDTNDHAHNVEAAANAIAAIVQAPGLRAENETLTNELGHYMAESHQRTEERDTLAAEVKRLRDALADRTQGQTIAETAADVQRAEVERLRLELEKPVAGAWEGSDRTGWFRFPPTLGRLALKYVPGVLDGTQDKARHGEDLNLLAAGYRLVGGVHPLPDEVRDGT